MINTHLHVHKMLTEHRSETGREQEGKKFQSSILLTECYHVFIAQTFQKMCGLIGIGCNYFCFLS